MVKSVSGGCKLDPKFAVQSNTLKPASRVAGIFSPQGGRIGSPDLLCVEHGSNSRRNKGFSRRSSKY